MTRTWPQREGVMLEPERVEILILGSGEGGKYLAWHMAQSGRRTAVVERRWIGGSCPNVNCLPSKNEIWSAKVAELVKHAEEFGMRTGSAELDCVPPHLIVLGGGYVGLELAQAYRRFGSRVTIVERGPLLAGREDPDVADAIGRVFSSEGIELLVATEMLQVKGRSGDGVSIVVRTPHGERTLE